MKTLTITIDDDTADQLHERAKLQGGRSVSSLIREACAEKLERDKPAESPVSQPEEGEA